MSRVSRGEGFLTRRSPACRRKLKARKFETGRDCATNKRKSAQRASALPNAFGNSEMQHFSTLKMRAQNAALRGAIFFRREQFQRLAQIKMPDFSGIDTMPARLFTCA